MLLCTKETFNAYETLKLNIPTRVSFPKQFSSKNSLIYFFNQRISRISFLLDISLCLKASQFPETAGFY